MKSVWQLLGKGSGLFRLDRETGRVYLNGSLNAEANDEKFYLRLRATDLAGHITESQLVIHVLREQVSNVMHKSRGLLRRAGKFM
jgi:hypothetical protein